jgi:crotonobetainyl-CoA:carnitine CoA-transferase CaiB-like acyl-CoA transferase
MRLPGTPAAAIHLVGEPLSATAVACESAAAGRPFLRAPLVDATSPAPVPRLTATPATLRHAGRARGADTDAVLGEWLGLALGEIAALRGSGAV